MDQASTNSNNMDGECEDSTAGQGIAGLALEGNIVQGKTEISSGKTYIAVLQERLTVLNIKVSCPCSIKNAYLLCNDTQKSCIICRKTAR